MTSDTIIIKDGGGAGCLCAGFTGTGVRLLFHDPAKGTRQPAVGRDRCIRLLAKARTAKGYDLANQGLAPTMIVSPATAAKLKQYDKTFRTNSKFTYLKEDRADTTFQNALLVARLIRSHGLTSALLVTSDNHMPRSYILLTLQLMGSGVSVRTSPVEAGRFGRNPMNWTVLQKKRVYNEMIELWGSLAEMGHYYISGGLPEREMGLKRSWMVGWLRSVLLFDVTAP
jgi:uncharacterized SAM-binding protein YcdF (DUF218 family)